MVWVVGWGGSLEVERYFDGTFVACWCVFLWCFCFYDHHSHFLFGFSRTYMYMIDALCI